MTSMAPSAPLSSYAFTAAKPLLAPWRQPHLSSLLLVCPSKFTRIRQLKGRLRPRWKALDVKSEFDVGLFERDLEGSSGSPPKIPGTELENKAAEEEEPPCPPGLRKYETMVVLRPDMSEDERLTLTQKYEELLVAGEGMYVEVFNRGVIPLAYGIKKKNKAGETNTYLDGIYLLFTYFTKPESIYVLTETLLADDNVIRSSSFKIRKRKLF